MKSARTFHEYLVGTLLFPATSSLFNRRGIPRILNRHLKLEKAEKERIKSYQIGQLKKQLLYAWENTEYYKNLFGRIGFDPNRFAHPEDLKEIPPLSRQDLIENRMELIDRRFAKAAAYSDAQNRGAGAPHVLAFLKRNKVVRNTSSGSTGAPTVFYENGSVTAQNWSNELRVYRWYGLKPGVRQARFVRFTTDFSYDSKSNRMRRALWNQLILPGVNLRQEDYPEMEEKIKDYDPRLYWGFTTAITGLAEYIKTNDLKNYHKPELIVTWAAPLYDFERNLLEEVFQCSVTNIYGMREAGHLGCFCPHDGFHIFQDSAFLEEEDGELLVTPLYKTIMPLIRFRTGDLGNPGEMKCPCGRTLAQFLEFTGRTGEVFYTKDDRMISPNFWCRTFMDNKRSKAVQRFQVIYKKDKSIEIHLVKTDLYDQKIEEEFRTYLKSNLGTETDFSFRSVDEITPTTSGKYQMVLKE